MPEWVSRKIPFVDSLSGDWGRCESDFTIKIHHWSSPPSHPPPFCSTVSPPHRTGSPESSTFAITVKYPWLLSFCPFYLQQLIRVPLPFSLPDESPHLSLSFFLRSPFTFLQSESASGLSPPHRYLRKLRGKVSKKHKPFTWTDEMIWWGPPLRDAQRIT